MQQIANVQALGFKHGFRGVQMGLEGHRLVLGLQFAVGTQKLNNKLLPHNSRAKRCSHFSFLISHTNTNTPIRPSDMYHGDYVPYICFGETLCTKLQHLHVKQEPKSKLYNEERPKFSAQGMRIASGAKKGEWAS